jgi:hypothetical protein
MTVRLLVRYDAAATAVASKKPMNMRHEAAVFSASLSVSENGSVRATP